MSEGGIKNLQFEVEEDEDIEISKALDQMNDKEKEELN
jgi:hypothetical protein